MRAKHKPSMQHRSNEPWTQKPIKPPASFDTASGCGDTFFVPREAGYRYNKVHGADQVDSKGWSRRASRMKAEFLVRLLAGVSERVGGDENCLAGGVSSRRGMPVSICFVSKVLHCIVRFTCLAALSLSR